MIKQLSEIFGATTGFITPFGYNRLRNLWIYVLGKKASRRASARLRGLVTSGLDHKPLARSRYKTSYETSCKFLCITIVFALSSTGHAAVTSYVESINGDISGFSELLAGTGTKLNFDVGINTVSGTVSVGDSPVGLDDDSFAFSVPSGGALTNIAIEGIWSGNDGSWGWGIRKSITESSLDTEFVSRATPSKDPFLSSVVPLVAGDYAFVLEGVGGLNHTLNYELSFEVSPSIPSPGALVLATLGSGLVGWMRRRRGCFHQDMRIEFTRS